MESMEIEAIYEDGVFRPLKPLDLEEPQHVTITVNRNGRLDPLADLWDTAYMERCAKKSSHAPGIEAVRHMLSSIKGAMADTVLAEREDRF